jgi:Site-specific recombinase XerD
MAGDGILFQKKSNSKWYWVRSTGWDPTLKNGKGDYGRDWIDLETTDKGQAKINRDNIKADIVKKGRYTPPTKQTYGQWLQFWLDEIIKPKTIDEPTSTYDYYECLIRVHIKPKLGSKPLKEIDPEALQKFFNQLRLEKKLSRKKDSKGNFIPSDEPLSTRTLRGVQDIITMSLDKAVAMRKIPENPFVGLDKIQYRRNEVAFMTTEQVTDFLDKIKYDPWFSVYVVDFGTGLRRSEIAALKWKNVDLENKRIKVEKAKVKLNTYAEEGPKTKLVIKGTKSKKGMREIPIPDDAVEALKKWRETQIKDMWEWESKRHKEQEEHEAKPWKKPKRKHPRPEYQKSDYVFTFEDGRPVTPDHLTKHFQKLLKKHGYEGLSFHKQRHSFVTMLLENKEDFKTIQELLGDSTMKIVSDTYSHIPEKLKDQAANKLSGYSKKKAN